MTEVIPAIRANMSIQHRGEVASERDRAQAKDTYTA